MPTVSYDVSVVTSGHDVADARLHRIVAAAVRAGLTVEVLGTGVAEAGPAGCEVRTWTRAGFTRRLMRALTLPWRARGTVLLTLDPDVSVGAEPARRARNRRLVVDVHEDYAALLRDRAWAAGVRGLVAEVVVRLASAVAGRADLTVVADEHVPPAEERCRRRIVIPNVPDLQMVRPAGSVEDKGGGARAVYVGDVRRSRGLEPMVEAIAAAPGWTLDIVGPVSPADSEWLEDRISQPDVTGRVRLHGRLPPAEAWRIAYGAAVGLALLDDTPAFRAAMPTKVYEYLAAGMAVVATPLPRVERLLADTGGGRVVAGAAEAASLLHYWSTAGAANRDQVRRAALAWADRLARDGSPYDVLAAELTQMCRGRHPGRRGRS